MQGYFEMNFDETARLLVKDLTKEDVSFEKLEKILEKIEQGHMFFKYWVKDRRDFQKLKANPIFHGHIHDNSKGWMSSHNFPVTLEILNKVLVPGGKVTVPGFWNEKRVLLMYYALCPELENFVSLIVWIDTNSSKNAWVKIAELVEKKEDQRVLKFSEKCGIFLPNRIHPSYDKDAALVTNKLYKSLYEWQFAYYLFDDGKTIISHNSPLNFRRMILDEWKQQKPLLAEVRTTVGRLTEINRDSISASIPCIAERPKMFRFLRDDTFDSNSLKKNALYFFQIFKIAGPKNIEMHVRSVSKASPIDIAGMFLAYSLYLLYLDSMRLKILTSRQCEEMFNLYYQQVVRFCNRDTDELDTMSHVDWKSIQFGFTDSFTRWIGDDLYVEPPLLRTFLSQFDSEASDFIIQKFDRSFANKDHVCLTDIHYNSNGNRMFTRMEKARISKFYDYINFLINEKRFILNIQKQQKQPHPRDEQISWLKNKIS